jgi:hypothetical protein
MSQQKKTKQSNTKQPTKLNQANQAKQKRSKGKYF